MVKIPPPQNYAACRDRLNASSHGPPLMTSYMTRAIKIIKFNYIIYIHVLKWKIKIYLFTFQLIIRRYTVYWYFSFLFQFMDLAEPRRTPEYDARGFLKCHMLLDSQCNGDGGKWLHTPFIHTFSWRWLIALFWQTNWQITGELILLESIMYKVYYKQPIKLDSNHWLAIVHNTWNGIERETRQHSWIEQGDDIDSYWNEIVNCFWRTSIMNLINCGWHSNVTDLGSVHGMI